MSEAFSQGAPFGIFTLIRPLGEGGFAKVWLAEQQAPLARRVALKILKPGMDSLAVLTRFQFELETQAQLQHPGIARILDAGHGPKGQPYLVVELVADAAPITDWCSQHSLDVKSRLALFLEVCAAIHYAHQQGIIHRDLKPSNVLVNVSGVKVIDFGIAKALTDAEPSPTLGTTGYMSPEQAAGSYDVDIRSDVYALGALLRDLAGTTPPRDLRAIIQRCLESQRAQRYPSAHALAEDVRRFIDCRPITARSATVSYLAGRLIRRHKATAAAFFISFLGLIIGTCIALNQAQKARKREAQAAAMTTELIDVWKVVASDGYGSIATVAEVLADRVAQPAFEGRLSSRCRVILAAHTTLNAQGFHDRAEKVARQALSLAQSDPESEPRLEMDCLEALSVSLKNSKRYAEAVPVLRQAHQLAIQEMGSISSRAVHLQRNLGSALMQAGDPAARTTLEAAIANARSFGFAEDGANILQSQADLAELLIREHQEEEALSLMSRLIDLAKTKTDSPETHGTYMRLMIRKGKLLSDLKRHEEALEVGLAALTFERAQKQPDSYFVFLLENNRVADYMQMGRAQEAETVLERVFEEKIRLYQLKARPARSTALTLAKVYVQLQHWEKLDQLLTRVFSSVTATFPYPYHNEHIAALAKHYDESGDAKKATEWRARASAETKKKK
jgi:eukaryotic-like serine/threonine-protein kinase